MAGPDLVVRVGVDAGRDAHQHRLHAAGGRRQPLHLVELAHVVDDHQPAPGLDRRRQVGVRLVVAVDDHRLRARRRPAAPPPARRPRPTSAPSPSPDHRRDHRHRGVRLAGVHRPRGSGVALQPRQVGPRPGPQLELVVDVQRRAELRRQRGCRDATQQQLAPQRLRPPRRAARQLRTQAVRAPSRAGRGLLGGRLGEPLAGGHPRRHPRVRLAEGHALAHQLLGQVGGDGAAVAGGRRHPLAVEAQPAHAHRQRRQRPGQVVDLVEAGPLVLLQVAVVGQRQPLEGGQQPGQPPDRGARLAPHQLRRVRVLLLRHHRAAGGGAVVQLGEAVLGRRPQHQLLADPRQVHHRQCRCVAEPGQVVAVGHRIQRVRQMSGRSPAPPPPIRGRAAGSSRPARPRPAGTRRPPRAPGDSRRPSRVSAQTWAARCWPSHTGCARWPCV